MSGTRDLRIAAVFIIFALSALGSLSCLSLRRYPHILESTWFKLIKSLSAGCIAGVGFIHVLPEAVDGLATQSEFPWAYVIALYAVFLVLGVEQLVLHSFQKMQEGEEEHSHKGDEETGKQGPVGADNLEMAVQASKPQKVSTPTTPSGHAAHSHDDIHGAVLSQMLRRQGSKVLTAHLLELGIVLHSVIIGISLGVISDNMQEIRILIVALGIHQFFEGISLASCIIQAELIIARAVSMCLIFSITTPIGICVGIGISTTYDESSATAAITQGVISAAAAGVLIYMSLVTLIAEEWSESAAHHPVLKVGMFASMCLGTAIMAVLAIWA